METEQAQRQLTAAELWEDGAIRIKVKRKEGTFDKIVKLTPKQRDFLHEIPPSRREEIYACWNDYAADKRWSIMEKSHAETAFFLGALAMAQGGDLVRG